MLKESKNKIIAVFQQNIDALKKEIKGIDEKYKKLAEEEKKELKEMLEYWKAQRNALNDGKGFVVAPAVEEQPETTATEAPAEEEEEKVVDTIFPENNEPEEEETPEFDGAGFTEEDNQPEEKSELSDIWPEETVSEEVPAEEEGEKDDSADDNDGWPEFPEEWK